MLELCLSKNAKLCHLLILSQKHILGVKKVVWGGLEVVWGGLGLTWQVNVIKCF